MELNLRPIPMFNVSLVVKFLTKLRCAHVQTVITGSALVPTNTVSKSTICEADADELSYRMVLCERSHVLFRRVSNPERRLSDLQIATDRFQNGENR